MDIEDYESTTDEEETSPSGSRKPKTSRGKGKSGSGSQSKHKKRSLIKWDSKRDKWYLRDLAAAKAFTNFLAQGAAEAGSDSGQFDTLAFERALSYAARLLHPVSRARGFDELWAQPQFQVIPLSIVSAKPQSESSTLLQLSINKGIGLWWNKIMFDVCMRYGHQAVDPYKLHLLKSQNQVGQNIFHSLAMCMNHSNVMIRNEAIQLLRAMFVDPSWFGPRPHSTATPASLGALSRTLLLGDSSGKGEGEDLFTSTAQTILSGDMAYKKLRAELIDAAMSQSDLAGTRPIDVLQNPALRTVWIAAVSAQPAVLTISSLAPMPAYMQPTPELPSEYVDKLRELLDKP